MTKTKKKTSRTTTGVAERRSTTLSDLSAGCAAEIASVDPSLDGLVELGFVQGARITPRYSGFGGEPRVYELEGSLVGLRNAAARLITVKHLPEVTGENCERD